MLSVQEVNKLWTLAAQLVHILVKLCSFPNSVQVCRYQVCKHGNCLLTQVNKAVCSLHTYPFLAVYSIQCYLHWCTHSSEKTNNCTAKWDTGIVTFMHNTYIAHWSTLISRSVQYLVSCISTPLWSPTDFTVLVFEYCLWYSSQAPANECPQILSHNSIIWESSDFSSSSLSRSFERTFQYQWTFPSLQISSISDSLWSLIASYFISESIL